MTSGQRPTHYESSALTHNHCYTTLPEIRKNDLSTNLSTSYLLAIRTFSIDDVKSYQE